MRFLRLAAILFLGLSAQAQTRVCKTYWDTVDQKWEAVAGAVCDGTTPVIHLSGHQLDSESMSLWDDSVAPDSTPAPIPTYTVRTVTSASGTDEFVHGYYRKNGVYVNSYYRTAKDYTPTNNYSYTGNINPYTGKRGSHSH